MEGQERRQEKEEDHAQEEIGQGRLPLRGRQSHRDAQGGGCCDRRRQGTGEEHNECSRLFWANLDFNLSSLFGRQADEGLEDMPIRSILCRVVKTS